MIMKKYLLIFLLMVLVITLMLRVILSDKIIYVQLVIPPELLPYYEWLISFPGIKTLPAAPSPNKIPSYNTYQN